MTFTVDGQTIEITSTERLVAGSRELYTASFEFDASWDGYERVAVFKAGATRIDCTLEGDACTIPWEVLTRSAWLAVGVFGIDGDRVKPTIWAPSQFVEPGSYGPGDAPAPPTPTVYEQLLNNIQALTARVLPAGGTAGQLLYKASDDDYDAEWRDLEIPSQYGLVTYDQDRTITVS